LNYCCLTVFGIVFVTDTLFTAGLAKKKSQTKMNKPGFSVPSHNALTGEVDLFEDPLMVVTKK
jgi:hypothetical protein